MSTIDLWYLILLLSKLSGHNNAIQWSQISAIAAVSAAMISLIALYVNFRIMRVDRDSKRPHVIINDLVQARTVDDKHTPYITCTLSNAGNRCAIGVSIHGWIIDEQRMYKTASEPLLLSNSIQPGQSQHTTIYFSNKTKFDPQYITIVIQFNDVGKIGLFPWQNVGKWTDLYYFERKTVGQSHKWDGVGVGIQKEIVTLIGLPL